MPVLKPDSFFLKKIFTWSFILRAVMIISLILALWKKDYVWVFGTFIGIFISFLPTIFKQDIKITLPWIFDFFIALITVLHVGGRLLDYYINIPGYILFTRFIISLFAAFISFTLIYILDEYWEGLKMNKYAMAFVAVIVTMSFGVIFEFVKWLNITGTYYVKTNYVLMLNLTLDTMAGIIIAIIGVILIKKGEFDEMTEDFGRQINESVIHRKKIKEEDK
jgi:hypothetical protein